MTTEYKKPLPQPTSITKPFWDGTKEHVLRLQKCLSCGQPFYYARNVCPHCLSDQLEWFNASGKGKVYSFTVAHRPTFPAFAADVPMVIAIIELEEGPMISSTLVDVEPASVKVGMPVQIVYEDHPNEGFTVPKFKLV